MIPKSTVLNTKEYRLRIPNKTDIDFIFSATQFSGFNEGMEWDAPKHKDELLAPLENNLKSWTEGEGYSFTIESKNAASVRFGRVSIRLTQELNVWDVGYWVHPNFQKKGILTECLGVILEFGFTELKAVKIMAKYAIWNKASEKVLIKNGFQFVKYIEKGFFKNNDWQSENEFCLRKEDWETLQS